MRTPAADRPRTPAGSTPEPERRSGSGASRPVGLAPGSAPSPARVADLQRSVGNAAVARMIRRERHEHGPDCGHVAEQPPVQRSLVHKVLRSPGRPLGNGLRAEMEARFGGADFSGVRLHSGQLARSSAAEVGARAYTSSHHVVMGSDGGDKHTLAHELGHYLQQRQGPVGGEVDHRGLAVSDPDDRWERAAEAQARKVMSGPTPTLVDTGTA